MGLSNKGDSIVVFTLVTLFFIFLFIFLIYVPRWIYLKIKPRMKPHTPSRKEMSNWFQQGADVVVSTMGRRNKVEQEARRTSFEDIELGNMSGSSSRGKVVVKLPERAKVSEGRLPGMI